jgi:hypothetical protein
MSWQKKSNWQDAPNGVLDGNIPGFIPVKRGQRPLDWNIIAKLAFIQCTVDEICYVFDTNHVRLRKECQRTQGQRLDIFLEKNRTGGKVALRRAQFEKAMDGDTTMQVWLGKQLLGQSEKAHLQVDVGGETFDSLDEVRLFLQKDPAAMNEAFIDVDPEEIHEMQEPEPEPEPEPPRKVIL